MSDEERAELEDLLDEAAPWDDDPEAFAIAEAAAFASARALEDML